MPLFNDVSNIEERAIKIIKERVANLQKKHDEHCGQLFENMKFNIEQEKLKYEEAKREHADATVEKIVGKIL